MDARVASLIDHTLLRPDATRDMIHQLCTEALQYGFAAVCIHGYWVRTAARLLQGSPVRVCTVAGFPLGAMAPEAKRAETEIAVGDGAQEIDMVLNIGALKSGELDAVRQDIEGVVQAAAAGGARVKVILECALLSDAEKRTASLLAKQAGAAFVKTSTGFGTGGATPEDVRLLREVVGPELGVKASGGIRTLEDVRRMVEAGANRIGTSSGVAIARASAH